MLYKYIYKIKCVCVCSGVLREFGRDVVSEGNSSLLTEEPERWDPVNQLVCLRRRSKNT